MAPARDSNISPMAFGTSMSSSFSSSSSDLLSCLQLKKKKNRWGEREREREEKRETFASFKIKQRSSEMQVLLYPILSCFLYAFFHWQLSAVKLFFYSPMKPSCCMYHFSNVKKKKKIPKHHCLEDLTCFVNSSCNNSVAFPMGLFFSNKKQTRFYQSTVRSNS